MNLIALLQKQYRGRLGLMMIVEPPSVFEGLWKVVQSALKERTRNRIRFCNNLDAFKKEATGVLHPKLIDRMLQECTENRGDVTEKVWTPCTFRQREERRRDESILLLKTKLTHERADFYRSKDWDDDDMTSFADAEGDDEEVLV